MLKPETLFNICNFPRGKINLILNSIKKWYLIQSDILHKVNTYVFYFYFVKANFKNWYS